MAPAHKVVLTTDRDRARAAGRQAIEHNLGLSNYVHNWLRLGFTEADVRPPGSDRLIDAVIGYGTRRPSRRDCASIWTPGPTTWRSRCWAGIPRRRCCPR